jgi:hypothetical protein
MTLASMIRQWQERRVVAREWGSLDAGERQALARDIGVSEELLSNLAARGPDAAAELPRLMAALSLDPRAIGLEQPALMRDMTLVCSECMEKARCRKDLAREQASAAYAEYCLNAETLRDMREGPTASV